MHYAYRARASKSLGHDEHQTGYVLETVAQYETTDKPDLLAWIVAVASQHGRDGDGTVDWISAWNEDPDDDWNFEGEATTETVEKISEELLAEIS